MKIAAGSFISQWHYGFSLGVHIYPPMKGVPAWEFLFEGTILTWNWAFSIQFGKEPTIPVTSL
jgi:hypothetical protein